VAVISIPALRNFSYVNIQSFHVRTSLANCV